MLMEYLIKRGKIDMSKIATSIPKEQQAIIVILELLEGNAKAEKAVSELTATDVDTESGVTILIKKLDKVFKSVKINEAYLTFSKFINFQKSN